MNHIPLVKKNIDIHPVKIVLFILIISACSVFLITKLLILQGFEQEKYAHLATNNYNRYSLQEAPRGTIYDRNGIVLAEDVPTFHLYAVPSEIPQPKYSSKLIHDLIGINQETVIQKITENYSFAEILLKENLSYEERIRLEENEYKLKGFFIKEGYKRFYPKNSCLCHVIGYTGVISQDDLARKKYSAYQPNERIGISGIERYYEMLLHGTPGLKKQTIDVYGHVVDEITEKEVIKGKDIYLTIDSRLQEKAEEIIQDHRGCLVLMNCNNGEIITCASNPTFDPNYFSGPRPIETWNLWVENRAFFNIATMGQYPPGSTFKPIVALFGLVSGYLTDSEYITCTGSLKIPGQEDKYRCWVYPSSHGPLQLKRAIQVSCDVYFYLAAERYPIESFISFLKDFGGISKATGIDLPSEESGFLGSPEWKEKFKGQSWFKGDSMNLGIGQGFLSVTPIQMTKLYAKIGNKGKHIQPHLLLVENSESNSTDSLDNYADHNISHYDYDTILEGMHMTTLYPGTASGLYTNSVEIAAKTGTALVQGQGRDIQHLWLGSIFPYEDPQYSCFLLFENSQYQLASNLTPFLKNFIVYFYQLDASEVN